MRLAVLVLAVLLTACGFELRGSKVLPEGLERLYLTAPVDLREQVSVYLEGTETRLVEDRGSADVLLTLSNTRFERRVLSVDPNTGKENEFQLAYSLDMSARRADGTRLVESQTITLLRDYVFDPATLLGSGREEATMRAEMKRDAVQQVLRRLQVATEG